MLTGVPCDFPVILSPGIDTDGVRGRGHYTTAFFQICREPAGAYHVKFLHIDSSSPKENIAAWLAKDLQAFFGESQVTLYSATDKLQHALFGCSVFSSMIVVDLAFFEALLALNTGKAPVDLFTYFDQQLMREQTLQKTPGRVSDIGARKISVLVSSDAEPGLMKELTVNFVNLPPFMEMYRQSVNGSPHLKSVSIRGLTGQKIFYTSQLGSQARWQYLSEEELAARRPESIVARDGSTRAEWEARHHRGQPKKQNHITADYIHVMAQQMIGLVDLPADVLAKISARYSEETLADRVSPGLKQGMR